MQFSTHSMTEVFFRVYKGTESLSPMVICLALNRQWQLQLALNSPMAVATCLLAEKAEAPPATWKRLKKQPYEAAWNSPVWLAVPTPCVYRYSEWRVLHLHVHIATVSGESSHQQQTRQSHWRFACTMHAFTSKTAPLRKLFQKHPIWGKKFLKLPQMGKFSVNARERKVYGLGKAWGARRG